MLSYNVAALLRAAPGTERRYAVDVDGLPISDDLRLAAPIAGEVRLSRTGRTILARAELTTAIDGYCSRCLREVVAPIDLHELDLDQPVREAIALAEPIALLCRPDCRGLCVVCGADLNSDPAHAHPEDDIDPRLASLAALRDTLDPH